MKVPVLKSDEYVFKQDKPHRLKDTRLPPGGVVTLNGPIAIVVSAHGGAGGSKVKKNCEKVKADAEAAKTAVLEVTLQSDT